MPTKDDTQSIALGELEAMLKSPGLLKIITNEVRADLRMDRANASSPPKAGVDVTKPSTFVLHDVVRLEPYPGKNGVYRAYSAEGDWTLGYPEALVRRLRQWREG